MLFSSLCLCRFIDFWSTSLSNSGFCRAIDRSTRWCVCVLVYTYFTWYECPSRNFFQVTIFSLLVSCLWIRNQHFPKINTPTHRTASKITWRIMHISANLSTERIRLILTLIWSMNADWNSFLWPGLIKVRWCVGLESMLFIMVLRVDWIYLLNLFHWTVVVVE